MWDSPQLQRNCRAQPHARYVALRRWSLTTQMPPPPFSGRALTMIKKIPESVSESMRSHSLYAATAGARHNIGESAASSSPSECNSKSVGVFYDLEIARSADARENHPLQMAMIKCAPIDNTKERGKRGVCWNL